MGKYSVPKEILAFKPAHTMVKRIGENYYVYSYNSVMEKTENEDGTITRKTKTTMGPCIGKITLAEGYVPNQERLSEERITGLDYGDYAFAINKSKETLDMLKKVFNANDANQIYVAALIFFVNRFTYMTRMKAAYDYSYLSLAFPDVHMGYGALRTLYENLGRKNRKVREFEQMMISQSSGRVAIDGHVIACTSECNDLSEYGYKAKKLGMPQINWMTAYDVVSKTPLFSQVFCGSEPDKVSLKSLLRRFTFSNTEFTVDRGFNTKENKELMSSDGNTYIVPLISGRKDYEAVMRELHFDRRRYFVYDKNGYSTVVYFQEHNLDNSRRVAFRDVSRASAERQDYIKALQAGKTGYSDDGLQENEKYFGLFLLETNNQELSAEQVFSHYKDRWQIETYYNYVRNDADFNALYQQDYFSAQGVSFVVAVAGMIYHDLTSVTNKAKVSLRDVMQEMRKLKLFLEGDKWIRQNNVKSVRTICGKLGFFPDEFLPERKSLQD